MSGAERVREHRQRKRRKLLCAWDGCHSLSGERYYCAPHRDARRLYEQERRQARKAAREDAAA